MRPRPYLETQQAYAADVRVILLSEGFTNDRRAEFDSACDAFCNWLDRSSPFNELQFKPGAVAVSTHFLGGGSGPALPGAPPQSLFGFSLDPARGALSVANEQRFVDSIQAAIGPWPSDHVVYALLLPDKAGSTLFSGTFVHVDETSCLSKRIVVATTIDGYWPQVVLRAMGEVLGLGSEEGGPGTVPSPAKEREIQVGYPNIVALPDVTGSPFVPAEDFKWWLEMTSRQRRGLAVFPSAGPQDPVTGLALFEGAGRYARGVYRSAADCVMCRPYVSPPGPSLKTQRVAFCPICDRTIRRLTSRGERFARDITLTSQRLIFDRVARWSVPPDTYTGDEIPAQIPVSGVSGERWSFLARIGAPHRGLRIERLQYTGYPNAFGGIEAASAPDVMELAEFRDVAIKSAGADGEVISDFDYTEAFTSAGVPPPTLTVARGGSLPDSPTAILHGLKLTLHSTCGGRALVRLELSLVLKATACDFDPGGIVAGARFYPQLAMTWRGNFGRRVQEMRGCVRMIFNNHLVDGEGHAGHGGDAPEPRTVANLFVDTNSPFKNFRNRRVSTFTSPSARKEAFPGNRWAVIFDYAQPDVRNETEFVAVCGPRSPKFSSERSGVWNAPGDEPQTDFSIAKLPRQGAYDNLHMHWNMGADLLNPAAVMAHAPGCGEACIHIHWRWGELAGSGGMRDLWWAALDSILPGTPGSVLGGIQHSIIPNPPEKFRGWMDGEPFSGVGMPLIPDNQQLEIALTHPDTAGRTAAFAPVLGASPSPRELDPLRKAVWYTVSVFDPPEAARQVVFEQGGDFAHTYNLSAGLIGLTNLFYGGWSRPPTLAEQAQILHDDYCTRRWLKKIDGSFVEQVPRGTEPSRSGTVTPEAL